jgi:hypothetical protein
MLADSQQGAQGHHGGGRRELDNRSEEDRCAPHPSACRMSCLAGMPRVHSPLGAGDMSCNGYWSRAAASAQPRSK